MIMIIKFYKNMGSKVLVFYEVHGIGHSTEINVETNKCYNIQKKKLTNTKELSDC